MNAPLARPKPASRKKSPELIAAVSRCRRGFVAVGLFSALMNVLLLTGPLFTTSELVLDAHVQTMDRDQIYPGTEARVGFSAFSQTTTPELMGKIERIASDQSGRVPTILLRE